MCGFYYYYFSFFCEGKGCKGADSSWSVDGSERPRASELDNVAGHREEGARVIREAVVGLLYW